MRSTIQHPLKECKIAIDLQIRLILGAAGPRYVNLASALQWMEVWAVDIGTLPMMVVRLDPSMLRKSNTAP